MSALPKPTALMSMGALRLVETGDQPEPRRLQPAKADAQLIAELRALRRENADLADKLQDSENRLRGTQKKLRGLQKTRDEAKPSIDFADAEEWVRHHVHLSWLENYSAIDRAAHPLGEYLVGPAFAESVRSLAPPTAGKGVAGRRRRRHPAREAPPLPGGPPAPQRHRGARPRGCPRRRRREVLPVLRRIQGLGCQALACLASPRRPHRTLPRRHTRRHGAVTGHQACQVVPAAPGAAAAQAALSSARSMVA